MYRYRDMTDSQRRGTLEHRRHQGFPLHAPPHFPDGKRPYILTAACFEHSPILAQDSRRDLVATDLMIPLSQESWADIRAWVILPNHWHILASIDLTPFREWIRIKHSSLATRWNKEDQQKGRQVWYRFQDRRIRSDAHYFASLNYVHANSVRHGCVTDAKLWRWSTLGHYLEEHGEEKMRSIWAEYPVGDYGKGWDW